MQIPSDIAHLIPRRGRLGERLRFSCPPPNAYLSCVGSAGDVFVLHATLGRLVFPDGQGMEGGPRYARGGSVEGMLGSWCNGADRNCPQLRALSQLSLIPLGIVTTLHAEQVIELP